MKLSIFILLAFCVSFLHALGEFRQDSLINHRMPDDPIVYPNQPGMSHMHDFSCATNVTAFSSFDAIINSRTTCYPSVDHSAYWVPTLIFNKKYISADRWTVYYHSFEQQSKVQVIPLKLRMISRRYSFSCFGATANYQVSSTPIPDCGNTGLLEMFINFPQCWDGVNLDSTDHMSHMAFATRSICPSTHPILLPRVQFKIRYPHRGGAGTSFSSGGGATAHGDFLNGWEPAAMSSRVINCLRVDKKCPNVMPQDSSLVPTLKSNPTAPLPMPTAPVSAAMTHDEVAQTDTDPISRPSGTLLVFPLRDSHIRDGSYVNDNYGDKTVLVVKNAVDQSFIRQSFITFDLTPVQGHIDTCNLELTLDIQTGDPGAISFAIASTSGEWDEDIITYANNSLSQSQIHTITTRNAGENNIIVDLTGLCQLIDQTDNKVFTIHLFVHDNSTTDSPLYLKSREAGDVFSPKLAIQSTGTDPVVASSASRFFAFFSFTFSIFVFFFIL